MKSYWLRTIQGRVLVVVLVIVVYIVLLVVDGIHIFLQKDANVVSFAELCIRFGFSALVALLFLAVGSITWLYAHDRFIAALLFGFTVASMISLSVETAALQGDALLSAIGGASSALSLLPLFALLLSFPKNSLSQSFEARNRNASGKWERRIQVLYSFFTFLSILCLLSVIDYAYRYTQPNHVPSWLEVAGNLYFPLTLVSILVCIPLT